MGQARMPETNAKNNAEIYTRAILADLEYAIKNNPEMALIIANSALAAVQIIERRYKLSDHDTVTFFNQIWQPVVDQTARI